MVVVHLKNLQSQWDSLAEKDLFLSHLYPYLLDLADELHTDNIQFIGDRPTIH
jgi:hypothetical protein